MAYFANVSAITVYCTFLKWRLTVALCSVITVLVHWSAVWKYLSSLDYSSKLQQEKVVFKIFLGILSSNLWCTHQKSDLVWIYLCIQGENNFVLHHHTSKRSRPFPICWLLENIPSEPEGDNTKQVKRGSHASKCIHTLKNVCLSASFSLPPYVQLTHTHRRAHTSHCSHSKYCVVRSHCCVSRSLWAC